jgi:inosine-uridine nucleoside N-ribohydrolase
MTNLAYLATTDPETMGQVKSVFSMCGAHNFDREKARGECNIILDPVAAAAAFQRNLRNHTVCPIDVTGGLALNDEEFDRVFAGDHLAIVRQCCVAWNEVRKGRGTGLHDPFTAACILDPSFCEWERGTIHMELYGRDLKTGEQFARGEVSGTTYFERQEEGPHRFAVGRDRETYIEHLRKTLAHAS